MSGVDKPTTDRSRPPASGVLSWAWIGVLIIGFALFEIVRRVVIATGNPNLVPTLVLLGAITVPVAFVVFIFGRRLPYEVSVAVVGCDALLGGVVGVVIAGTLEYDTLHRLGTLPMVGVGLIEETAKLVVPLGFLLFTRYRRPADGLLLGVACGAGFAVLETLGYAFVALANNKGSLAAVDGVLLWRGILSPAAHMAWTGLTAAALWTAAAKPTRRSILRFLGVFVVAVALHTAWDSIGTLAGYAVLAAISLTLLTLTAHRFALAR